MSNHITIELCADDRGRLDTLIYTMAGLIDALKESTPVMATLEVAADPEPVAEPAVEPEPVVEPEQPKYTKADVLAKVQQLAKPGSTKRDAAKAIVNAYGTKISDIPVDKYDEVMAKLTELEG